MKSKVAAYFCNGIGNWLMFTPAVKALSELYKSKVDIVLPSEEELKDKVEVLKEIISKYELVGKIIMFPNIQEQFDCSGYSQLFTTGHCVDSQAAQLFRKYGNTYEIHDWLKEYQHEIEYYMEEVYKLGYKGKIPGITIPKPENKITTSDTNDFICLYNGAAKDEKIYKWHRKKWHKFTELAEVLNGYYNCEIHYLGGKDEAEEGEELEKKFSFVKNHAGKFSFIESADIVRQSRLLISTDSSLMHAAEAVNTPVVALFGATLVSKNRPYYGKYEIVRGKCEHLPCQFTREYRVCNDYKCMKTIDVQDVMIAARKILNEK